MSKPLVIYHAQCADGFCSAWIARHFLKDCDLHPAQYGTDPPDVSGRDVFILDFSYKRPLMLEIVSRARSLVVLDHHKTAAAELEGIGLVTTPQQAKPPVIHFDIGHSGARLTWDHFARDGQCRPWLVDYVEDRDLWLWKLESSRELNAAIRSYPFDFALWDKWAGFDVEEAVAYELLNQGKSWKNHVIGNMYCQGKAILRAEQLQVDTHVSNAVEIEMDGYRILACNATVLQSEIAGKLAENRPFGAVYFVTPDRKRVWSLRSRDGGVDVSEIARAHGGGGHARASGFSEVI